MSFKCLANIDIQLFYLFFNRDFVVLSCPLNVIISVCQLTGFMLHIKQINRPIGIIFLSFTDAILPPAALTQNGGGSWKMLGQQLLHQEETAKRPGSWATIFGKASGTYDRVIRGWLIELSTSYIHCISPSLTSLSARKRSPTQRHLFWQHFARTAYQ